MKDDIEIRPIEHPDVGLFGQTQTPRCPACGYRMLCIGYGNYGAEKVYVCNRLLSDPKIHNEYRKAHPEEFQTPPSSGIGRDGNY